MVLSPQTPMLESPMQTITRGRLAPYIAPILVMVLAMAAVLPPKYLAPYIILLGGGAGIWALRRHPSLILRRPVLAILVPLALAGVFCLIGTLPVRQQSDIQLEFLKYGIYAGAFLLGLTALDQEWKTRTFIIAVIAMIIGLFIANALTPGISFSIDQSWLLYPPDQNNSSSIFAPFSAIILGFRPRWLKVTLLLILFAFFTFAESRLGVIVLFAVAAVDLLLDWKAAVFVLLVAVAVSGALSMSHTGAQTTVMRGISTISVPSETAPKQPERVSTNRIIEFGTNSDDARIKIYQRALDISARVFPNLLGLGDAKVTELMNTPPLDNVNVFQHAHNFLLQGYLAYGLIATLCLTVAAIGIVVLAVRYRNWYLVGAMALIGGYGMIEALISDLRVLTIVMMLAGSCVAVTLSGQTPNRERRQ